MENKKSVHNLAFFVFYDIYLQTKLYPPTPYFRKLMLMLLLPILLTRCLLPKLFSNVQYYSTNRKERLPYSVFAIGSNPHTVRKVGADVSDRHFADSTDEMRMLQLCPATTVVTLQVLTFRSATSIVLYLNMRTLPCILIV